MALSEKYEKLIRDKLLSIIFVNIKEMLTR